VEHGDDHTKIAGFAPPRSDLNAPDLYIPTMSFVTYVILVGIATGINAKGNATQTYPLLI
jgi:protein transport protein YIF1